MFLYLCEYLRINCMYIENNEKRAWLKVFPKERRFMDQKGYLVRVVQRSVASVAEFSTLLSLNW